MRVMLVYRSNLTWLLWSRFALPIYYRILQTLLTSTPKTIHNIELKLDIISKINLGNVDSYGEYSKFIINEVIRLRERRYTYKEIANNFKDRGIRSRRNKEFYKNLLVNMMWKYRRKLERESKKKYSIENIRIDVNKVNKDKKYSRF